MKNERIQVIERAVDIIDALSLGPSTLTEVVQKTELAKGTVFRILQSLSYGGLVVKDPIDNRYMLGPGLWRFGQNSMDKVGMMSALAGPILLELREATEETITLNTRIGLNRVCIVEHQSRLPLLYKTGVGSGIPLHVGASGKTLLAQTPEPQRKKLLNALESSTKGQGEAFDRDDIERQIVEIQERGWAVSVGERLPGAAGIAVPVISADHQALTVSVLGPESRLPWGLQQDLIPALQRVAKQIERRITDV